MHHLQTPNFYATYGTYITSNPPISHIFLVNFCIGQLLPGHEAVKKLSVVGCRLSVVGCREREPGLRGKITQIIENLLNTPERKLSIAGTGCPQWRF
jgi:hypothetical protein